MHDPQILEKGDWVWIHASYFDDTKVSSYIEIHTNYLFNIDNHNTMSDFAI